MRSDNPGTNLHISIFRRLIGLLVNRSNPVFFLSATGVVPCYDPQIAAHDGRRLLIDASLRPSPHHFCGLGLLIGWWSELYNMRPLWELQFMRNGCRGVYALAFSPNEWSFCLVREPSAHCLRLRLQNGTCGCKQRRIRPWAGGKASGQPNRLAGLEAAILILQEAAILPVTENAVAVFCSLHAGRSQTCRRPAGRCRARCLLRMAPAVLASRRTLLRLVFVGVILAMLTQPFFAAPDTPAQARDLSPAVLLYRHGPQFLPTRSLLRRRIPKWRIQMDNPLLNYSSDLQSMVLETIDNANRWCQSQGVMMKRSVVGRFWRRSGEGITDLIQKCLDLPSTETLAQTALHLCWLAFFLGVLVALWSPLLLVASVLGLALLVYVAQVLGPVSAVQPPL